MATIRKVPVNAVTAHVLTRSKNVRFADDQDLWLHSHLMCDVLACAIRILVVPHRRVRLPLHDCLQRNVRKAAELIQ